MKLSTAWIAVVLAMICPASAETLRVPLHDGQLRPADLSDVVLQRLHLPRWTPSESRIDLRGLGGCLLIQAMNQSLGEGCSVAVEDDSLILTFNADKLPHDVTQAKSAARVFTTVVAPQATADQQRIQGLLLPENFDPDWPLVVLIHGLDCNRSNWSALAKLLNDDGQQVAYFTYPSDQPLADSGAMLAAHMRALRGTFPASRVNLIAHSMGSLVARDYVEGDQYSGGVERLILIAPPNHGSKWAKYRIVLEVREHWGLWRHEPNWHPTWLITDGLGEAGQDLKRGSAFLKHLNARPRRQNVQYTIIAGNQHPAHLTAARWVNASARIVPSATRNWWGLGRTHRALKNAANALGSKRCDSDGPVDLTSIRLEGVQDTVIVHADHTTIYIPTGEQPPPAWAIIQQRLNAPNHDL